MHRLSDVSAKLLVFLLCFSLAGPATPAFGQRGKRGSRPSQQSPMDKQKGLVFRLSEGAETTSRVETTPADTTPLSEEDASRVLNRLDPIKSDDADQKDFAMRERSLPAPRTGKTVSTPFPAPETPPVPQTSPSGALEVLRRGPEGEVPLVPTVSITFSQPMVAITSQDEAAQTVPARITPEPPGKWRWVGTKTLLFEPDGRAPMATEYSVEVPAGVKSALGNALAKPEKWTFSTPPVRVISSYPGGDAQPRDPVMFLAFDQRIDQNAILKAITVRAGSVYPIRLATEDEIAADATIKALAGQAGEGRWIAFRVVSASGEVQLLPGNTAVSYTLNTGAPSAEGPRLTPSPQSFAFRTYGPLRVVTTQCGYNGECPPLSPWSIEFSNPIDVSVFDASQVHVSPELPGKKVEVYGRFFNIRGLSKGRTTYTVTLDPEIRDVFGQSLGESSPIVFKTTSAPEVLYAPGQSFVTLDPASRGRFSVYTINHPSLKVRAFAVEPTDWPAFAKYMTEDNRKGLAPPGRLVVNRTVAVAGQPDELTETALDLSAGLHNGLGHLVLVVEPTKQPKEEWRRQRVIVWVQATELGLDAFVDTADLVGWVNSLRDGRPVSGARVDILPSRTTATTDAQGIARMPLPTSTTGRNLLVARKGADVAILPDNLYWWNESASWVKNPQTDSLRWFVFDDRGLYRPKENVHIKGWIRRVNMGPLGDIGPLAGSATMVEYTLVDSRGNEFAKGTVPLNGFGGFDFSFELPDTINLGYTTIRFQATSGSEYVSNTYSGHSFQVQEFRRPEFEVSASASDGPHLIGDHAIASVKAVYYAGGGLANADVTWTVTSRPTNYTPPNWGEYVFGTWIPWWRSYDPYAGQGNSQSFAGRTDPAGSHYLRIDFDSVEPPRPSTVTAEASVVDVNRQSWASSTTMLVHPSNAYVGLRAERTFVERGTPIKLDAIAVDIDGKVTPGRSVDLRAVRLDYEQVKGEWKQIEADPQEMTVTSTADPLKLTFATKEGGTYQITATVRDDRERLNQTELTVWVSGGKTVPKRDLEKEEAQLIPDKKEYQPGDTAEILVQSPFFPAEGTLTLRRGDIVATERFTLSAPTYTLRIPIKEAYLPNILAQVDLVGSSARVDDQGEQLAKLPPRPAYATGSLNLSIPPIKRTLTVTATPRDPMTEPGAETAVAIDVRDASGHAVANSEVTVVVVDESVLALTGYRIADPVSIFYAQRGSNVRDFHSREYVLLGRPDDLNIDVQPPSPPPDAAMRDGVVTTAGGGRADRTPQKMARERRPAPSGQPEAEESYAFAAPANKPATDTENTSAIAVRSNFDPLAIFAPTVVTDADGRAVVPVKMPDNLTRYRVTAVAVDANKQFGSGESSITARMPLMVRPSAPRFLNFGDAFELPVVIQNQTDAPMQVNVAVRASNIELTAGNGRRVTVPANDRVEIRFPAKTVSAGTARFQVAGASGQWADAAEFNLPVWTPATTEAFATYGEVDQGSIVQPVKAPPNVYPQFGGLEITTSSTELQALTDAVLYLTAYPFECSEQISSRVVSIAALKDVLGAFKAEGLPKPEEMVDAVKRDLKRLQSMQNSDGGFPFWQRGRESWPYLTVHVAHALQRAKEKDFDVPSEMLNNAHQYLKNIERYIPSWYSEDCRRAIIAYALYVRNRMGDRDTARARKLIAQAGGVDKLPLEAVGWLLSVLTGDAASANEVAAIRRHLNNRVTETAGAANFVTSYTDGAYVLLHSARRCDGIILEALIADQPKSDLIPKIVRGLLAHRKAGHWANTQENAFVLLALDRYFHVYENVTPDFVARVWLGDVYAGEHEFRGRTTERSQIDVPMRYLAERPGPQNLILQKEGPGRLYYRLGMRYAPNDLKLEPADYGFTVQRMYEAIDDPADVRRDADGVWHIKAGARVRVKLTMVAESRRYHVALVDPMPAGLESLNPALATTGTVPADPNAKRGPWWWQSTWYEHQNLRDERAEAFTSLLWEGVYTYSYVCRATTPGLFVVPPAKAEEMYSPETFGRSGTDRVAVE